MFNRTKTQNPAANLKEHLGFHFLMVLRQWLSDFVNRERLNSSWRGYVLVRKKANRCKTTESHYIKTHLSCCVPFSTIPHILDNDTIIFESFAWLWMTLVVFDLLPSDAGRSDKIAFKVFIRDAAVFFQKVIDRLGKILVGLSNCWIKSEQSHSSSLPKPSEMSLYQFRSHFSDRKVGQSNRTLCHNDQVQFETTHRLLFRLPMEISV